MDKPSTHRARADEAAVHAGDDESQRNPRARVKAPVRRRASSLCLSLRVHGSQGRQERSHCPGGRCGAPDRDGQTIALGARVVIALMFWTCSTSSWCGTATGSRDRSGSWPPRETSRATSAGDRHAQVAEAHRSARPCRLNLVTPTRADESSSNGSSGRAAGRISVARR